MNSSIVEDPLFQLNFVLLATWWFPEGARINPILYKAGYRIYKISPNLFVPNQIVRKVSDIPLRINRGAKPEVLLKNIISKTVAIVECKRSSFSSTSSTAAQAVAYLVMCGNILRDALADARTENWFTELIYVVKAGNDEELLDVCLSELKSSLEQVGCDANPYNVCGLEQMEDGIYLNIEHSATSNIDKRKKIKVISAEDSGDFRPLYLIPLDIGINHPDEYVKKSINSRIRTSLVVLLMRSLGTKSFEIKIDDLLNQSLQLWSSWEDTDTKKYMRKAAKNFIRQTLHQIQEKFGINYTEKQSSFAVEAIPYSLMVKLERFFNTEDYLKYKFEAFPGQLELEL